MKIRQHENLSSWKKIIERNATSDELKTQSVNLVTANLGGGGEGTYIYLV
jgi:hypothetical protein